MNSALAYRRLKEVEEKKLANRLMLLRLELTKSRKKIEQTKTRTLTILDHRSSLAERHALKEAKLAMKESALKRAQELNYMNREAMETIKRANVMNMFAMKREQAQRIKDMKKEDRDIITDQARKQLARARANRQRIIEQEKDHSIRMKERRKDKRQEARERFNERVNREAEKGKECEENVQNMEKEEMALIKELEAVQQEQRSEFEMLEKALGGRHPVQLKRIAEGDLGPLGS